MLSRPLALILLPFDALGWRYHVRTYLHYLLLCLFRMVWLWLPRSSAPLPRPLFHPFVRCSVQCSVQFCRRACCLFVELPPFVYLLFETKLGLEYIRWLYIMRGQDIEFAVLSVLCTYSAVPAE